MWCTRGNNRAHPAYMPSCIGVLGMMWHHKHSFSRYSVWDLFSQVHSRSEVKVEQQVMVVCWGIWKLRNEIVWKKKSGNATGIMEMCDSVLN